MGVRGCWPRKEEGRGRSMKTTHDHSGLSTWGWRNMKGNVYHATSTRQRKLMVIEGMSTYSVVITIVDGLINIGLAWGQETLDIRISIYMEQ